MRAAGLELLPDDDNLQAEIGKLADETRKVRKELEGQLDATAAMPGAEELERLTVGLRAVRRLRRRDPPLIPPFARGGKGGCGDHRGTRSWPRCVQRAGMPR